MGPARRLKLHKRYGSRMNDRNTPAGRLFGIETEYGLLVEGKGAGDLMEESRLLVRAHPGAWAGVWDHHAEDARRDMRGYRVERLHYDEADARYDREGPVSHLS